MFVSPWANGVMGFPLMNVSDCEIVIRLCLTSV
jgi:hypothetical protein